MLPKLGVLSLIALAAFAQPTNAFTNDKGPLLIGRQTEVVLTGQGFFPDTVYALPGDSILLKNDHDTTIVVRAKDGSWNTGDGIAPGTSRLLQITEGMSVDFEYASDTNLSAKIILEAPLLAPTNEDLTNGGINPYAASN